MSKIFKYRKEKLEYIEYVISTLRGKYTSSGFNIVFCLTALTSIILFLLGIIESQKSIFELDGSALLLLVIMINVTAIVLNLFGWVFHKARLIKTRDNVHEFFGIMQALIFLLLLVPIKQPASNNTNILIVIIVINMFLGTLYLLTFKSKKTGLSIIVRKALTTIILGTVTIGSVIYMFVAKQWAISINEYKIIFSIYLAMCILYMLLINLFNSTISLKLESLRHQYIRRDIKFKEVLKYIDEHIYAPPLLKTLKGEKKNDKLPVSKKGK